MPPKTQPAFSLRQAKSNIERGRLLRDFREALRFPFWFLGGGKPPDNHCYKTRRIRRVARRFDCGTFIETGTFFGQTVAAVHGQFRKTMSVELSTELFDANRASFEHVGTIRIFHGDSGTTLGPMISQSLGNILYWLDGHYSGGVTAQGHEITPVLAELDTIRDHQRHNDCILIDDARLFTGSGGYPRLEDVRERLLRINSRYTVTRDRDCLLALPPERMP